MNSAVEGAGFVLVLGFLWFVWPPLVLLGAGVLLVTAANARRGNGRTARVVGAAWAAARAAYRRQVVDEATTAELRRVA